MSEPMNFDQLGRLLCHIRDFHSPLEMVTVTAKGHRAVKYVEPHVDMRDGMCFAITFRGYGWEKHVHTQNECRDLPISLFNRCMDFLDGKETI